MQGVTLSAEAAKIHAGRFKEFAVLSRYEEAHRP